MASLRSLPEHMIGVIYSLLPDAASKRAFFSSSHLVHSAPTVLDQVRTLVIPYQQLCNSSSEPARHTLAFPRAAHLKKLVLKGEKYWYSEISSAEPDYVWLIISLLCPDDEGMRAKLQQVTHMTLDDVRIKSDYEAGRLGHIVCSLPCLQALTLSGSTAIHSAFFKSFSKAANGLSLKEMYCTQELDASGIRAVSCLHSLKTLSFGLVRSLPSISLSLRPLSSLSALVHLSIDTTGDYEAAGLGDVLPQLTHLRMLKLVSLRPPSLIAAMPPSLHHLHLRGLNASGLCECLRAFASGQSSPALSLLHVEQLNFDDCANLALPVVHGLGRSAALHFPSSPSSALVIDRVDTSPGLRYFIGFFEHLPTMAQGLKFVNMDPLELGDMQESAMITPMELTRLAMLCPNLEGLAMNNVLFQDMLVSLREVASSFPRLSSCSVGVMISEQPGYAGIFMAFFAALALNREMHAKRVRFYAWLGVDRIEGVEEGAAEQLYISAEKAARDLQRSWEQLSSMLPGKACDVVFNYYIDNFW